jgi:phosphoglycolate phosphatase
MSSDRARFHPLEAVIFDLDGTLVDTLPDLAAALNRLLAEEGHGSLDHAAVAAMLGDGAAKLVERAFAAIGRGLAGDEYIRLRGRFLEIYESGLSRRSRPYPGVIEMLAALRAAGLRLAICTNKPEAPSHALLAALGLAGYFDAVVGGDTLEVRKPHGRHLTETISRAGASTAVMIGDTPNDVVAARNAGVPVIAVSHGYAQIPAAELGADAVIDHFRELEDALIRLIG